MHYHSQYSGDLSYKPEFLEMDGTYSKKVVYTYTVMPYTSLIPRKKVISCSLWYYIYQWNNEITLTYHFPVFVYCSYTRILWYTFCYIKIQYMQSIWQKRHTKLYTKLFCCAYDHNTKIPLTFTYGAVLALYQ